VVRLRRNTTIDVKVLAVFKLVTVEDVPWLNLSALPIIKLAICSFQMPVLVVFHSGWTPATRQPGTGLVCVHLKEPFISVGIRYNRRQ